MTPLQLAKLRQKVRGLKARRNALEYLAMKHNAMLAAYFLERRLHKGAPVAHYLSVPTPQGSRHLYVRKALVDVTRRQAAAWREFGQGMAQWVRVNKEIESSLREIGKGRCREIKLSARKAR